MHPIHQLLTNTTQHNKLAMKYNVINFIFLSATMVIWALPISLLADQVASLHGGNNFLVHATRLPMLATCKKYPRVCRTEGSPGPDCCRGRCVNVDKDRLNCGKCGNRCKFSEVCCKGKCVNPWSNKKHCGGCNNKCSKGNRCVFGMCDYA